MRYLLQAIDQLASSQRGKELRLVLAEAREGADEKNAVLEFYETLERITNELRNTTEHSTAFLQKVRKAEAPNYYEVIKRPMDLGTVLKKVKGQQYKDKKAFAADLELIWSNCFEYNTLPSHPLRHSATELRKKANNALQYVSDIHRPSYSGTPLGRETPDAEGESDEEFEADDTASTRKGTVSRKRGAAEANKSRARRATSEVVSMAEDEVDEQASRDSSPASQSQRASSIAVRRRTGLTTRTDIIPFEEKPALVRTRDGMTRFVAAESRPIDALPAPVPSTSAVTLDMPAPVTDASVSPASKPLPLPLQQLLPNGRSRPPIPKSEPMVPSLSEPEKDPLQAWWEQAGGADLLPNAVPLLRFVNGEPEERLEPAFEVEGAGGLSLPMAANLATLRQIGKRRQELLGLTDQDAMQQEEAANGFTADLAPTLPFAPSVSLHHANAKDSAALALRAICVTMLAHAGFDAASGDAVNVLLNLLTSLLCNLGRTARVLYDRVGSRLPAETLTVAVLEDNGAAHPADLKRYVERDIFGFGDRLQELLARLRAADALDSSAYFEVAGPLQAEGSDSPRFVAPPSYIPLDEAAIASQIGLLQPVFRARLATEHLLHEDEVDPVKVKVYRPKVPPSGKIPTKRRAEKDPNAVGMGKKAKKQKKAAAAAAAAAATTSAPSAQPVNGTGSPSKAMDVDELEDLP